VRWGHEVAVGYFGQEHTLEKDSELTVIEWLAQYDPMAGQQELRGLLGQIAFQRRRCNQGRFARFPAVKPAAHLVLPADAANSRIFWCSTSPPTTWTWSPINALNISLQKFEGTVLLVTHDHDVIDGSRHPSLAFRSWPHRKTSRDRTKTS